MNSSLPPSSPQTSQPKPFFRGKFRLRTTLFLPFMIQLTGAVGLVGWLSFRSGEQSVQDLAQQLRAEVITHVSDRVSTYVEAPQLVNRINLTAIELGLLDVQDFTKAETYFWHQAVNHESIGYVGFATEENQYLRVGWVDRLLADQPLESAVQLTPGGSILTFYELDPQTGDRLTEGEAINDNYDVGNRPFYHVAKKAGKATWSPIYTNIAYPILQMNGSSPFYGTDGEFLGIVTCQLGLNQISKFLQSLNITTSGEIYIIERDGNLVATSLANIPLLDIRNPNRPANRIKAWASENQRIQTSALALQDQFGNLNDIETDEQLEFYFQDERQFMQISPFSDAYGLDWLIVVVVPESTFMGRIDANNKTTMALCLATLGAVILTSLLTSRLITKPIDQLVMATEKVATGDLNHQVGSSVIIEVDRLANAFNTMAIQLQQFFAELEDRVTQRTAELSQEKERSEQLLLNILPSKLVKQLKVSHEVPAEYFAEATILFVDLVGFTTMASEMEPLSLVNTLNAIFSAFDTFTETYGLEKIKTIGDAYMVAGGIPVAMDNHSQAIADMALAIQAYMQDFKLADTMADTATTARSLQVRLGINTGPVIAGVIGQKKFIYDLWGDAVNIAARMESHGDPGRIQVTQSTYDRLKDQYHFEPRGTIFIKGRGDMTTYWLLGQKPAVSPQESAEASGAVVDITPHTDTPDAPEPPNPQEPETGSLTVPTDTSDRAAST
ncbi:adenylate/guanylate cyclase domain-containing protein [Prochlorothrix hollandica]|uniref:adenylate/guanylate cyclase domain-containing protein n=1 Tax=Prochlorothrix hollandica TaxID=1223 RepID=UPI003341E146